MGKEISIRPLKITEIRPPRIYEHIFIGTVDGEVIGTAGLYNIDWDKREAEFRIVLLPEWQDKGYGEELTRITIERGLTCLKRIWLGFDEGNERARKIYERLGFKYYLHKMQVLKEYRYER